MPIILPQLPESMFSSYDPRYVPGYIGYTPKHQIDKGKIYGNATLKSDDYEPGLRRSSQLPASGWGDSPALNLHFGGRISNTPRGDTENWNNKNGYFQPLNGKYYFTRMNHTHDGNPETSSAIKAIEEIKYELSKPAKWTSSAEMDRFDSLRDSIIKQTSRCSGRNVQISETPSFPSYRNEKMKKKDDFAVKELSTRLYNMNDYLQRRQGKLIYRTDSGLLPNYSGYTPGQMFDIGNTWGRSSVNAMQKMQEQSFQWTSLF